jgi:hypothetical protein
MKFSQYGFFGSLFAFVAVLFAQAAHADSTVTVTPDNMGVWATGVYTTPDGNTYNFNTTAPTNQGPGSTIGVGFVTGPATPPAGVGSANLYNTSNGENAPELYTSNFANTPLSSITSLSYYTYVTQNNGQQFPFLSLQVNLNDGSGNTDTLIFEPPYQTPSAGNSGLPNQGATQNNAWQKWNALTGGWWDNNGVLGYGGQNGVNSLATFSIAYPNATISPTSAAVDSVGFLVGAASASDQFNGYVDDFTVGINGTNTSYDFEPSATPPGVPEPSAIIGLLGLAGMGGMGFVWKRRNKTV